MSFGKTNPTEPTNPTMGENFGSTHQSSASNSESWRDPQSVWGGQSPYLQSLYGMGQNRFADIFNTNSQSRASGGINRAQDTVGRMQGGGIDPQMRAYQRDVLQGLRRHTLPSIQGDAAGFGQMGSSRHGIAEGLALSDANQQVTDMAADLYGQQQDRRLQAAAMAPGLSLAGMSLPWYSMQQYAGLLGRPTVLGGAAGSQSSSSSSGGGETYGYNYGGGGGGGGGGFEIGYTPPFE